MFILIPNDKIKRFKKIMKDNNFDCFSFDLPDHEEKKDLGNTGYIYLIKAGQFYKIGKSKVLRSRLKRHQTSNPNKIKLIVEKLVLDCHKKEKQLLKRFRDKKVSGEWFRLNKEDILWIKQNI
jgi:hypothetical protein